jgi:hypothetical protein
MRYSSSQILAHAHAQPVHPVGSYKKLAVLFGHWDIASLNLALLGSLKNYNQRPDRKNRSLNMFSLWFCYYSWHVRVSISSENCNSTLDLGMDEPMNHKDVVYATFDGSENKYTRLNGCLRNFFQCKLVAKRWRCTARPMAYREVVTASR